VLAIILPGAVAENKGVPPHPRSWGRFLIRSAAAVQAV